MIMVAHKHGTGRGTLGELIAKLFGRRYVRNIPFKIFAGQTYQAQYTDWGASTLIAVVSESSEASQGSLYSAKRDTYEHLKEIVEPRAVERYFVTKGRPSFMALSFTSYLIATNNIDALPIPADDRRFAVLSNGEPREPGYWSTLNTWMENEANIAAFASWLLRIDITEYSPYAVPIRTATKASMTEASKSDLDHGLEEVIASLASDVFVPEQVLQGLAKVKECCGYDYPDRWHSIVKRLIASRWYRVGEPRGANWTPQIGGRRFAVFARSQEAARKWTIADAKLVRAEILKNGDPSVRTSTAELASRLRQQNAVKAY